MKYILIALCLSLTALAQNMYVTGPQMTLRTGPDNTNKIIKMLDIDAKVQVLEQQAEWSKVKTDEDIEGWIMNRFLQKDIPASLRLQWLKAEYEKLKVSQEDAKTKHNTLIQEFNNLKKELSTSQAELKSTTTNFEELKKGSSEYLELKALYDKTVVDLKNANKKVKELESKLIPHYIYWFLAGAGVLLVGWIIGMTARKKSSYSSRIRL